MELVPIRGQNPRPIPTPMTLACHILVAFEAVVERYSLARNHMKLSAPQNQNFRM